MYNVMRTVNHPLLNIGQDVLHMLSYGGQVNKLLNLDSNPDLSDSKDNMLGLSMVSFGDSDVHLINVSLDSLATPWTVGYLYICA